MLLFTGAVLSAFLGYKLLGRWAPAALACVVLAAQAIAYQGVLNTRGGLYEFSQLLVLTGLMCLIIFYATFSIGRSIGQRRRKPR